MLIKNNKTFEQYLEELSPTINKLIYKYNGLKTEKEDLRQEATILLWSMMDKLNSLENPKAYFAKCLNTLFFKILIDEHKQGLWISASSTFFVDGEEFDYLDIVSTDSVSNIYITHDPWLENYLEKQREYHRAYNKEYYEKHKEQHREYYRNYNYHKYHNDPNFREKRLESRKKYYNNPENREKIRACSRRYYYRHAEKRKEYAKEYRQRPVVKEKIKEYHKKYYEEIWKEKAREYNQRPDVKEKHRESAKLSARRAYIRKKLEARYKEAATMTLEELKNNYEKIRDEILDLKLDLDLLRAIEEPNEDVKRKIFCKEYELESLEYIKESIKNEIDKLI